MTTLQVIESIYDAFLRGDIPHIVNQLRSDVFWRQPASVPWGGDYSGPEEVSRFFSHLNELVETTGFEIEDNIEAKDQIVSYGFYSSRNRVTGKHARVRFVFRWQFAGGKVARFEAVLDSAPIADAARADAARA